MTTQRNKQLLYTGTSLLVPFKFLLKKSPIFCCHLRSISSYSLFTSQITLNKFSQFYFIMLYVKLIHRIYRNYQKLIKSDTRSPMIRSLRQWMKLFHFQSFFQNILFTEWSSYFIVIISSCTLSIPIVSQVFPIMLKII